jgi:hypothetical protein
MWTDSTSNNSAVSSVSVDPSSSMEQLVCQAATGDAAACNGTISLPGHTWGTTGMCWFSCGTAVYARSTFQLLDSNMATAWLPKASASASPQVTTGSGYAICRATYSSIIYSGTVASGRCYMVPTTGSPTSSLFLSRVSNTEFDLLTVAFSPPSPSLPPPPGSLPPSGS